MNRYYTFFEEPGEVKERYCGICGTKCSVERNRMGPTSWAQAIGNSESLHDYFRCPYAHKQWHKDALKLVMAIEETPSKRLAELMRLDLIDILEENDIQLDKRNKEAI